VLREHGWDRALAPLQAMLGGARARRASAG
jgi:hypothetical protein